MLSINLLSGQNISNAKNNNSSSSSNNNNNSNNNNSNFYISEGDTEASGFMEDNSHKKQGRHDESTLSQSVTEQGIMVDFASELQHLQQENDSLVRAIQEITTLHIPDYRTKCDKGKFVCMYMCVLCLIEREMRISFLQLTVFNKLFFIF